MTSEMSILPLVLKHALEAAVRRQHSWAGYSSEHVSFALVPSAHLRTRIQPPLVFRLIPLVLGRASSPETRGSRA